MAEFKVRWVDCDPGDATPVKALEAFDAVQVWGEEQCRADHLGGDWEREAVVIEPDGTESSFTIHCDWLLLCTILRK